MIATRSIRIAALVIAAAVATLGWNAFPKIVSSAPDLTIAVTSVEVMSGDLTTVQVEASSVTSSLAGATIEVSYDPSVLDVVECVPDPDGLFDAGFCNPDFDTDRVRFNVASTRGVEGDAILASITFQAVGSGGESSALDVFTALVVDRDGGTLSVSHENGSVAIVGLEGQGEGTDDSGFSVFSAWLFLLLIPIGVGLVVVAKHFAGRRPSASG